MDGRQEMHVTGISKVPLRGSEYQLDIIHERKQIKDNMFLSWGMSCFDMNRN